MADGDEVQFKSPTTGAVQVVPPEHWDEAIKQGYTPTTHKVMYSPDGQRGMVSNAEQYKKAQSGFTFQPKTQFEEDKPGKGITTEGMGDAAWDAVKQIPGGLASMFDPTRGLSGAGLTALGINPREGTTSDRLSEVPITAAVREARAGWNRPTDARAKIGESVTSGLGALFGMSGESAAQHGERGEGGAILGEAAVPAATAIGGAALTEGLAAARPALRNAAFKELPTNGPQLTRSASRIARAGGTLAGGAIGSTLPVPGAGYAGGVAGYELGPTMMERILGTPELGDIRNPGPFSKVPTRAPKTPLAVKPVDPVADAVKARTAAWIPTKMPKPAPAPESPLIVPPSGGSSAGEPRFTGSEGRAATWTNEKVLSEAARGNRVAIEQANRRGLDLPPNTRYVMGDPDLPRAVYNPKETTIFSPEGTPIRNVDNPTVRAPRQRITVSGEAPQEPTSPSLDFEQTLKVPSETPLSEVSQPRKPTPLAVQPERRVSNAGPSGVERRQADIDYQQAIQSTPPGTPTPGEQLSEDIRQARAGQPSGTTEGEALQQIMRDPERYEQYKAADQKTRDRMLITAKNELGKSATPLAVQPASVEEEPVETQIKGITAPSKKTPLAVRPKAVPIERRFSSDEITEAEGLLASESGAMSSADRPGVYFDESEPGDVRTGSRQIRGGDWRGVKSGRDMYPFMREHPEWGPEAVQKALRNKDSAAYRKMMEAAMDFLKRGRDVEDEERAAIQEE